MAELEDMFLSRGRISSEIVFLQSIYALILLFIKISLLLTIKLESIWIAFSFYPCLFKIYFIFQCLSRPWVHLGLLLSLADPGTALILLMAQDPTQGLGTASSCPREFGGFCLHLSWLIPQPAPFPQRFLMSRAGAVCSTPCHALPWLFWHSGPWKHHPSQHHNNIYSLFLKNYNNFFFFMPYYQTEKKSSDSPFCCGQRFVSVNRSQSTWITLIWQVLCILPPFSKFFKVFLFFSTENFYLLKDRLCFKMEIKGCSLKNVGGKVLVVGRFHFRNALFLQLPLILIQEQF